MSDNRNSPTSGTARQRVEVLAEQFIERYRRGEQPALSEYAQRHPDLADEIRELFPTMLMLENAKPTDQTESSAAADAPIASRQLGDYRILREIGRGGMGVVYEAEQLSLGRHVALKVLSRKLLERPTQRARFEREAQAAAKLHHTNIVPVFGVGQSSGTSYYVMQYIQGLSLDSVLKELRRVQPSSPAGSGSSPPGELRVQRRGSTTGSTTTVDTYSLSDSTLQSPASSPSTSSTSLPYWRSIAQLGVQVAGALQYAHDQGVLHRDIKPANLLLDLHGTVWITDFGLAKFDDDRDLTHSGDMLGTLRYMAPETFRGDADERSEIYSLGLTLYELLAFRPAFDASHRHTLVEQVMTAAIVPLHKLAPNVPRDLQTIVHKAIEREPQHRYQTAEALAEDLQRFIDDVPIRARKANVVERVVRWSRRNRALAAASAAVLVLLLVINTVVPTITWRLNRLNHQLKNTVSNLESSQTDLQAARDRAREHLYAAHIALSENQLITADSLSAQRSLHDARSIWDSNGMLRRMGWEWYYLNYWANGAARRWPPIVEGRGTRVHDLAFSPDGKFLASSHGGNPLAIERDLPRQPGVVIIRDFATGRILHRLRGHTDVVARLAFSPDGRRLATAGHDHRILFWDVDSGQQVGEIHASHQAEKSVPFRLRFSDNGRYLLAVWRSRSYSASDIYSPDDMQTLHTLPAYSIELDCSAERIFMIPQKQQGVHQRQMPEAQQETPLAGWDQTGKLHELVSSPQGNFLAAAGVQRILLWNLNSQSLHQSLAVDFGNRRLTFSPDERLVCVYGASNFAQVWDTETGRRTAKLLATTPVSAAAFSADGRWLVTGADAGWVRVFAAEEAPRAKRIDTQADNMCALAFSADNQYLQMATWQQPALLRCDLKANRSPVRLPLQTTLSHYWPRRDFAFNARGTRLAAPREDASHEVAIWQTDNPSSPQTLLPHPGSVYAVTFSADDQRLATVCLVETGSELHIWDAHSGTRLRTLALPYSEVRAIAFSPDGRCLATAGWEDTGVHVWDPDSGKLRSHHEVPHKVLSLAFSPNSQRLAAAFQSRPEVVVWDLAAGRETGRLAGFRTASDVAWSPDGTRLAVIGREAHVHLFDATSWERLIVLRSQAPPTGTFGFTPRVSFSGDGSQIAGIGPRGIVTVWDAGPLYAHRQLRELSQQAQQDFRNQDDRRAIEAAQLITKQQVHDSYSASLVQFGWSLLGQCYDRRGEAQRAAQARQQGQAFRAKWESTQAARFAPQSPAPQEPPAASADAPHAATPRP